MDNNNQNSSIKSLSKKEKILIGACCGLCAVSIVFVSLFAWKALSNNANTCTFSFEGTNCTINGQANYTHSIYVGDKNLEYTITANEGYNLPKSISGGDVGYNPSTGVISIKEVTSNISITAVSEIAPMPGTTHTIYLDPNGGTIDGPSTLTKLAHGFPVTDKPILIRDGYNLDEVKWLDDKKNEFTFGTNGTPVVTDLFLHAQWGEITKNKVHFVETSSKTVDKDVDYGYRAVYYTPTNPGFTFKGWYTTDPEQSKDLVEFDFNSPITQEKYAYAKWEVVSGTKFTVNFSIQDTVISYKGEELKSSSITLDAPVGSEPYYVKFSVKGKDTSYLKPGNVSFNPSSADYIFNKENGDLFINLKNNYTVTGKCDIYKSLDECSWKVISEISSSNKAREIFRIGDEKSVNLINPDGSVQAKSHKVRIIGFDEDYSNLGDKENTKIGITFEFSNVISNNDGYGIATQWNDIEGDYNKANYNYLESSIRKALNGVGASDQVLWAERGNTSWSDNYNNKSVMDMLPSDLKATLKNPEKNVLCYENEQIVTKTIKDCLFMLSPREMNYEDETQEPLGYTSTYSYYYNTGSETRYKEQVKPEYSNNYGTINKGSGQKTPNNVRNYAGFNERELHPGSYYYLRTPSLKLGSLYGYVWQSDSEGNLFHGYGTIGAINALPVAPAFCI